jgi:DUF4097 and DUF4098 domain-containing protein YvlB
MTDPRSAKRSGCALTLGVLLVVAGSLLLASNLFGFSLAWFWGRGIVWFGLYWPLILILWGAYKVYQRIVHPETARVGAGEIFLLIFIVLAGLTVHVTKRLFDGVNLSIDDIIEGIDSEVSFGPAHTYTAEHRFESSPESGLVVDNGRGSVTVHGWDEGDIKLSVTKRVYRHSEERASEIAGEIRARFETPDGEPARLAMELTSEAANAETDLELWIPAQTPLTLSNRRGPLRVSGIRAPVGLATSNDSIEVKDVTGDLKINGRRGPVRIDTVDGDVEARNRYGTLSIKNVTGNLVGETSNGSIYVENVTGTARLMNRHSRIRATQIDGDLTIEASHTEVSAEMLGATAYIETSYRPIFIKDIEGRLTIEARSSEIEVRDVQGSLDIDNIHRAVTAVGVGGGVDLTARRGAVRLEEIQGPIRLENSYHPVNIRRFFSSLNVTSEHAPITVSTDRLEGEIRLATTYSEVGLELPPASSFRLEAKVTGGNIESDFRRANWTETRNDELVELRGTAGGGALPVVIVTTYGDIEIAQTPQAEAPSQAEAQ